MDDPVRKAIYAGIVSVCFSDPAIGAKLSRWSFGKGSTRAEHSKSVTVRSYIVENT